MSRNVMDLTPRQKADQESRERAEKFVETLDLPIPGRYSILEFILETWLLKLKEKRGRKTATT
jgi:hypothetical protein